MPVLASVKLLAGMLSWPLVLTAAVVRRDGLGRRNPAARGSLGSGGQGGMTFGVPGAVFVVAGVAGQAAVEDADEPVREGSKGLVVAGSAGALPVVVGAGARRVC